MVQLLEFKAEMTRAVKPLKKNKESKDSEASILR